jgi:hypothetical protein
VKNLELLDVRQNALTRVGVAVLEAAGVAVVADDQHAAADQGYLYEGDAE